MYYNFLTFKEMAKKGELFTSNEQIANNYGRIGLIEVFFQERLESFLDEHGIEYFGTPKTLTECMRVLEGWDTIRVPRLRNYVAFSNFIYTWCKNNFPDFDETEWRLGEQRTAELLQAKGTTNVREGIKYFWKNYLTKKRPKVTTEDTEIDVVGGNFYNERRPDFILVGEDALSMHGKDDVVFKSFSSNKVLTAPRRSTKNKKNIATTELIRETFPDTTIILFESPVGQPNFSMMKLDEVKEGTSSEVSIIASGLRFILENKIFLDALPDTHEASDLVHMLAPLVEHLGVTDLQNVNTSLQKGYSVLVRKLELRTENTTSHEIIVKSTTNEHERAQMENEFLLYTQLASGRVYRVPKPIMSWENDGRAHLALEFVNGATLSEYGVDKEMLEAVLYTIIELQRDLMQVETSLLNDERKKLFANVQFDKKLAGFLFAHMGQMVPNGTFAELEEYLNTDQSKRHRAIVSDRNPANWIKADDDGLTVLDLGLTRMGSEEDDWIWFIDSHTLKTLFSRSELIQFYLDTMPSDEPRAERERRLHFSAIYLITRSPRSGEVKGVEKLVSH